MKRSRMTDGTVFSWAITTFADRFPFGNDGVREQSAKLLVTLLMTLHGPPYVYQGDEIGMTNVKHNRLIFMMMWKPVMHGKRLKLRGKT